MFPKDKIKEIAFQNGVDLFGIAPVERFDEAPKGFHPKDVHSKTESILAFAIQIPTETLFAENPVPFTHMNHLATQKMDNITYNISMDLEKEGLKNVLIPTDDPYLYWDSEKQEGRAILSLRHIGMMAGLGKLGRNNLLINHKYGSMIQIGALLTPEKIAPDNLAEYEVCPPKCRTCLDSCPKQALTGETVVQELCRPISNFRTEKGYSIKKCFECRKRCPHSMGIRTKIINE